MSAACRAGCSSVAGIQRELKPWMTCPASGRFPDQKELLEMVRVITQDYAWRMRLKEGSIPIDSALGRR